MIHNDTTHYVTQQPLTKLQVLETASAILAEQLTHAEAYSDLKKVKDFLTYKLAHYEREVFGVMLLDSQHRLLSFEELFMGTINTANIYPREVVKVALQSNAAAVIFGHNHPSGHPEPSYADRQMTKILIDALKLVDIRVLDHIVVGHGAVSFAEQGFL